MIENRLTRRYRVADAACVIVGEVKERQVFNISMGGMLMERLAGDVMQVGDKKHITVNIAGSKESFVAKVVRVQENSFGMIFTQLSEEESDFLYRVLGNRQ